MIFVRSSKRSKGKEVEFMIHVLSHIGNLMQLRSPYGNRTSVEKPSETAGVSWRTSENLKDTRVDP